MSDYTYATIERAGQEVVVGVREGGLCWWNSTCKNPAKHIVQIREKPETSSFFTRMPAWNHVGYCSECWPEQVQATGIKTTSEFFCVGLMPRA